MTFGALCEKAEQGDREASFRVAVCYAKGDGVDRDIEKAVEWYTKAYWQGYSAACCFIGRHVRGCGPDFPNGAPLCKRIVYRGDARFQFHQGVADIYAGKDIAGAVKWLGKAAKNGHPESQLLLGRYNESGMITTNDVQEAREVIQAMIPQYEETPIDERTK
jgi:TPR repeat protein